MSTQTTSTPAQSTAIYYTLAYFAAFVLLGMAMSAIGPSLPSLADHTGSPLGEIGYLFLAASLGYLLGSLTSGWAYDQVRGHRLLAGALVSMAVTLVLAPLIGSLPVLTAVMLLLGFGEGMAEVGCNLLLVWIHRGRAAPYLNGLHFFFGLGAMLIPVIVAGSIERLGGIGPAFWLMAGICVVLAVYTLRLPSPSAPDAVHSQNGGPVNWAMVALLSLVFFFYVGAESGFGGWIFTYAIERGLGDVASAGLLTSLFWGALMAGRLVFIPLAYRLRPERVILAAFSASLVSVLLMLLLPELPASVWAGALLLGFFNGPIFPTLLAFAERRMTLSANASRWFFVGTGAGGMFLPWLIGRLFAGLGPASMLWTILIDLTLGLGIFALARRSAGGATSHPGQ